MPPYLPSVVDRFTAWADRLPGPVWLFYLLLLAVLILIINGITWLDGSVPVGTIDHYRTSIAFYPVSTLALIHYLNRIARHALRLFRPALDVTDAEYATIEYELTTLPRGGTRRVLLLSLLFTLAFMVFTPNIADVFDRLPGLVIADFFFYVLVFGLIAAFMYHTVRQLRMVSRLHESATNINLFQSTPLYAFSLLTTLTGAGVLMLNYFSIVTDPNTFVNPALYALTVVTSVIAVACFILPLTGMHERVVTEKNRLLAEVNSRLETTIQAVYERVDSQELTGVESLKQLMDSLVTSREVIRKIPTWPWDAGTLTGFISASVLPFILQFIGVILR
jgi:hypothetical protein